MVPALNKIDGEREEERERTLASLQACARMCERVYEEQVLRGSLRLRHQDSVYDHHSTLLLLLFPLFFLFFSSLYTKALRDR